MREAALAKLAKARQYAAAKDDAAPAAAAAAAAVGAEGVPSLRSQAPSGTSEQPPAASLPALRAAEWGKSAAGTSAKVRCPFACGVQEQQKHHTGA